MYETLPLDDTRLIVSMVRRVASHKKDRMAKIDATTLHSAVYHLDTLRRIRDKDPELYAETAKEVDENAD